MQTVNIGKMEFKIPRGYKHVKWEYTKKNDTVYLIDTHNGNPCAYGPFKVVDPQLRKLLNEKINRDFLEYPESLLVKE